MKTFEVFRRDGEPEIRATLYVLVTLYKGELRGSVYASHDEAFEAMIEWANEVLDENASDLGGYLELDMDNRASHGEFKGIQWRIVSDDAMVIDDLVREALELKEEG